VYIAELESLTLKESIFNKNGREPKGWKEALSEIENNCLDDKRSRKY
jgi:hypothetical protein